MKRHIKIMQAGVLFIWGLLVASVQAQQTLPTGTSATILQAVSLWKQGKPQEARAVLGTIDKTNANYGLAKCYDALCLSALNDKRAFLKEVESPAVQGTDIPVALREELDFQRIDALFFYRKFEDLLARTAEFRTNRAASARLNAVAEYRLAGLFERGMRKAYESSLMSATNGAVQQWADGRVNLQDFLTLASAFKGTNYQVLPDRVLQEDVWTARLALGQEQALLNEIPAQATADRERVGLLGIRLYKRIQPAAVDDNLQRMTKFINDFPESKSRKRVEFDMASISFSRGEALSKEAEATKRRGDRKGVAEKRAMAAKYFNYTRSLQDRLVVDTDAGITAEDVFDRQADLLHSYHFEGDYGRVLGLATEWASHSVPGSVTWLMTKVYRGIALDMQQPADLRGAAAELDAVLAAGLNGKADHDREVLAAAGWRLSIARALGDQAKRTEIIQWVKNSNCSKNQKTTFLNSNAVTLAQKNGSAN